MHIHVDNKYLQIYMDPSKLLIQITNEIQEWPFP